VDGLRRDATLRLGLREFRREVTLVEAEQDVPLLHAGAVARGDFDDDAGKFRRDVDRLRRGFDDARTGDRPIERLRRPGT
jgi:hypothetical protein